MMPKTKQDIKFAKELGRRLKAKMTDFELTQMELSRLTDVTQSEISNIVNGKNIPRADTVVKLARALNMSTDELINFEI